MWSCSTLKKKMSRKDSNSIVLTHQENLKDQALLLKHQERELMKYFGASATLMLTDGFRFNRDSGLIGNTARIHVRAQSLSLESQNDTLSLERLSGSEKRENAQVKVEEIEKFEERESSPSRWWLLVLIPVFWFVAKRRL
jgi:hypothetical protein